MQPPKRTEPRSLTELASSGEFGSLIERAQLLSELDRRLRQSLPEPLRQQCKLANVRADRLVFLVNSSVWSAKLRMYTDTLLSAAAACGLQAASVTVKVATMQPVPPDQAPHTPLSTAARDALRAAAGAVTDPELKDRLLRLASLADE